MSCSNSQNRRMAATGLADDLESGAEDLERRARHWAMWARTTFAAGTGNHTVDLDMAADAAARARNLRNFADALRRLP